VGECKKKPELSGNDFLPMVLKLDELLAHLRSVREMAARLTTLKDAIPGGFAPPPAAASTDVASVMAPAPTAARAPPPPSAPKPATERPARRAEDLSPTLQSMAERLAQDHAKRFRLTLSGLGGVPAVYTPTIKDCLIQMLRNAAVHGIEPPSVRLSQAKDDTGTVHVDFRKATDGYE